MYLKALEIIGFKSFADKVRLNFEPGVSCIVGPNGCGKSNVIDSVRWAIGEMSWKSLRSGSMVDIIFNGTKQRPPQNMAQVNMIFDNSKRELPIDFSEVTVSRKIYRSGESEYYLNRVQCRLKDIREMFLDTGIGGEGYAIIDQGSISRLLENAGPLERREMFEEVAGVSKYKAKRDEAIRKLEHVDLDIARLSDTLALIAEQIKKLDSEARKARLYQKYREELKESEIALALENIKSHDAEINKTSFALEPILKEMQDLQATISALEGEAAALDLNLTHKQKEYQEFNEKISAAKYQIGLLEGVVQNCQNLTGELTLQLQSSKAEDDLSKKRLLELAPALQNLQKQLDQATEALVPLQEKYNQKYAQVKQNEEQLKIVQEQMESAGSKLLTLAQEEMELSGKIALEESAIAHENNNLINLQRSLEAQKERTRALDEEIKNFQETVSQKEQEL
ncbi:MAG: AAA family ATPase, partial [Elusimicrobiaceae bacterium]|nr:AAA family ATPase [Elusimicrobiaceae bacterium]